MEPREIAQKYLESLEKADLTSLLDLFSKEGNVHSPIYGSMPAGEFYKILFEDTQQSQLTLKGIFQEVDKTSEIAIYFTFGWTLANGEHVAFDVVDVLVLDAQGKIDSLTIIYDTQESRPAVTRLQS